MRLIVGTLLLGLLGACMAGTARPPPEHGLEAGFWLDPPDCVVVLPGTAIGAIAAPVLRSGTVRARPMKAAGPSASV